MRSGRAAVQPRAFTRSRIRSTSPRVHTHGGLASASGPDFTSNLTLAYRPCLLASLPPCQPSPMNYKRERVCRVNRADLIDRREKARDNSSRLSSKETTTDRTNRPVCGSITPDSASD